MTVTVRTNVGQTAIILESTFEGQWWWGFDSDSDPSRKGIFESREEAIANAHIVCGLPVPDTGKDEQSCRMQALALASGFAEKLDPSEVLALAHRYEEFIWSGVSVATFPVLTKSGADTVVAEHVHSAPDRDSIENTLYLAAYDSLAHLTRDLSPVEVKLREAVINYQTTLRSGPKSRDRIVLELALDKAHPLPQNGFTMEFISVDEFGLFERPAPRMTARISVVESAITGEMRTMVPGTGSYRLTIEKVDKA